MRYIKSPILHFILIGTILYFLYERLKPLDQEVINITSQTIDALVQQQKDIQQGPITVEQRDQLIKGLVEDEILLKVAYSRGLDKNDFRVRKRLLSLIRSSLNEIVPEPSYTQLQAFYKENEDQYLSDTLWSFKQVFFNFNSEKLPVDTHTFLERLKNYENPDKLGDFSLSLGPKTKVSFNQIALSYGKPFAEKVIYAQLNQWIGPVESITGLHYLKVFEKHNPELPSFEHMESYLRQDYIYKKTRELQEEKINELSKQFDIVVEGEAAEL